MYSNQTVEEISWEKERASFNILKKKNWRRYSMQSLNTDLDQPTELSRQASEKKKYSTLDSECFPGGLIDFLWTEEVHKKKRKRTFEL